MVVAAIVPDLVDSEKLVSPIDFRFAPVISVTVNNGANLHLLELFNALSFCGEHTIEGIRHQDFS